MWNIIAKPSVRLWNYGQFLRMKTTTVVIKPRSIKKAVMYLDPLFLQVHCYEYTL